MISAGPIDDVEQGEGPGSDGEQDELQHVVPPARRSLPLRLRLAEHFLPALSPPLRPHLRREESGALQRS